MKQILSLQRPMSLRCRATLLTVALIALSFVTVGMTHVAQADPIGALSVSVSVDKDSYAPGDTVGVTVNVTNNSDTSAHNVGISSVELSGASFVLDQTVNEVPAHTTKSWTVQGRLSSPGSSSDGSTDSGTADGSGNANGSGTNSGSTNGSGASGSTNGSSANSTSGSNNQSTNDASKRASGLPTTGDDTLALIAELTLVAVVLVALGIRCGKRGVAVLIVACVFAAGYASPARAANSQESAETAFSVNVGSEARAGTVKVSYLSVDGSVVSIDRSKMNSNEYEGRTIYSLNDAAQDIQGTLSVGTVSVSDMSLSVTDDHGIEIYHCPIDPKDNWTTSGVGLLRGTDTVKVSAHLADGSVFEDSLELAFPDDSRTAQLMIDRDDPDADGIPNYLEQYWGTDPHNRDTDGDGIDDETELIVFGYDPLKADTDSKGIKDGDEDFDKDSISNIDEITAGITDPTRADTDHDGLKDKDESDRGADPNKSDTDGDGMSDGWEVEHGTNPVVAETKVSFTESKLLDGTHVTLSLTTAAKDAQVTSIVPVPSDEVTLQDTPGYLAGASFLVLDSFDSARVAFSLPTGTISSSMYPVVYHYDPETQHFDAQPTTVSGNDVSFVPTHFSIYLVIDENSFDSVWNQDIRDPGQVSQDSPYDFSFVLDCSQSMEANDPKWYRKSSLNTFINKMRDTDRASLISFTALSQVLQPLTSDKGALALAIDKLQNDDGWHSGVSGINGRKGLEIARDTLAVSPQNSKAVFFMTDGDGTELTGTSYSDFADQFHTQGTVVYVFLLGPQISGIHAIELQALADKTGGKLYHGADEDMPKVTDGLFQETVDYTTDSNSDGISDYFSKLICDGTIGLANGTSPYKGIDFNSDADYDHDGIKNGDEIEVRVYYATDATGKSVKRAYLHKKSDPVTVIPPFNFNSRAMAMMAALSYIDATPDKLDNGFYISLANVKGGSEQDNGQRYLFYNGAKIWQDDINSVPSSDYGITKWKIVDFTNGSTRGGNFSATTFINSSEKAVVITFRGTDETTE